MRRAMSILLIAAAAGVTSADTPDKFVEYVESSGVQYVDTGIIGRSGTKAEMKFNANSDNGSGVYLLSAYGNSTYMNALPSQLRALLKPVRMNLAITSGTLYCWLPAEKEVFGSNTYADAGSETLLHQYTYYATPSNRIKQANGSNVQWYERSLVTGDAATCAVSTYGSPTTEGGTTPCGIAPCGCI